MAALEIELCRAAAEGDVAIEKLHTMQLIAAGADSTPASG